MGFEKQAGPRSDWNSQPRRWKPRQTRARFTGGFEPATSAFEAAAKPSAPPGLLGSNELPFPDIFSAVRDWNPTSGPSICRGWHACQRLQIIATWGLSRLALPRCQCFPNNTSTKTAIWPDCIATANPNWRRCVSVRAHEVSCSYLILLPDLAAAQPTVCLEL